MKEEDDLNNFKTAISSSKKVSISNSFEEANHNRVLLYIICPCDVKDRLLKANHNQKVLLRKERFDVKDRLLKANHNGRMGIR